MTANYCSNCGNSVMKTDQFCRNCGQPLSTSAQQSQQLQPIPKRQPSKVNVPLILGLVAGALLIFIAIWLSLPDTAEAPTQVETNPVSQENAGLPHPEVARISVAEAKERFDGNTAVFVDTRDIEDYEASHIPGAVHMTIADIEARHMELTTSPEIITYCT
jgi:hypothetical protein